MQVFYSDQLSPAMVLPARIKLNDEESHHAIKSMRLKNGDSLILTDGKGYHYKAMMAASAIPNAEVIVNEVRQVKDFDKPHLHLAISLLKNPDRLEWMLEKAVELEIDEISFIICERTEKPSVNMERMKRIAIAALKQSNFWKITTLAGEVSSHGAKREITFYGKFALKIQILS